MANSFRYYNLSKMAGLGKYNGLGISWDAKDVVDLLHSDLSDYGSITSSADSFPNKGAGLEHEALLDTSFSLGGFDASSNKTTDFGSIA